MSSIEAKRHEGDCDVWSVAGSVTEGSCISVMYDSSRSDKVDIAEGEVVSVDATHSEVTVEFKRDDGQKMTIKSDGWLRSVGSHHPKTGRIMSLVVGE